MSGGLDLRVFLDALSLLSGGAQTHLRHLLLQAPRPRITLWITRSMFSRLGLEGLAAPIFAPDCARFPAARAALRALLLGRLLRRSRADLYFDPSGTAAVRPGVPSVTMVRNMLPFDPRAPEWYGRIGYQPLRLRVLARQILRAVAVSDGAIFVSEWSRRRICSILGRELSAATVIPHGVARFSSWESATEGQPDMLYVSDFEPYKRHAELILAYVRCRRDGVRLGRLHLVGGAVHPGYYARVRRLARAQPESPDILFPGRLDGQALLEAYDRAGIVAMVSAVECCPNILLEALASGRPVLCSQDPPMPEFAGDGALLVDASRPASLAQALARAAAFSRSERESLAQAALRRAGRYDWRETAARTWDFLATQASVGLSQNRPQDRQRSRPTP